MGVGPFPEVARGYPQRGFEPAKSTEPVRESI
jgi:hypothetical protein